MSHYFGEKIYNQMNIPETTFPTLEYGVAISGGGLGPQPFETEHKQRMLKHIFNKEQIDAMEKKLGRSIYFTHVFTELIKARKSADNFEDILELEVSNQKLFLSRFKFFDMIFASFVSVLLTFYVFLIGTSIYPDPK